MEENFIEYECSIGTVVGLSLWGDGPDTAYIIRTFSGRTIGIKNVGTVEESIESVL